MALTRFDPALRAPGVARLLPNQLLPGSHDPGFAEVDAIDFNVGGILGEERRREVALVVCVPLGPGRPRIIPVVLYRGLGGALGLVGPVQLESWSVWVDGEAIDGEFDAGIHRRHVGVVPAHLQLVRDRSTQLLADFLDHCSHYFDERGVEIAAVCVF